MKSYNIYASLVEDSISGFVWSDDNSIENGFIVIKNGKKKIRVYKRTIDENWKKIYNKNGGGRRKINSKGSNLIISEYYRAKLGIETNESIQLSICKGNRIMNFLTSNFYHPNPYIGPNIILAVTIAVSSLLLATYSFFSTRDYRESLNHRLETWSQKIQDENTKLGSSVKEINDILIDSNNGQKNLTSEISQLQDLINSISESESLDRSKLGKLIVSTNEIKKMTNRIDESMKQINNVSEEIGKENLTLKKE